MSSELSLLCTLPLSPLTPARASPSPLRRRRSAWDHGGPPRGAVPHATFATQAGPWLNGAGLLSGAGPRPDGLGRPGGAPEARFRATVNDPPMAGCVDATTLAEFKVAAGDQPSITAILLHMYLEA